VTWLSRNVGTPLAKDLSGKNVVDDCIPWGDYMGFPLANSKFANWILSIFDKYKNCRFLNGQFPIAIYFSSPGGRFAESVFFCFLTKSTRNRESIETYRDDFPFWSILCKYQKIGQLFEFDEDFQD